MVNDALEYAPILRIDEFGELVAVISHLLKRHDDGGSVHDVPDELPHQTHEAGLVASADEDAVLPRINLVSLVLEVIDEGLCLRSDTTSLMYNMARKTL